jgi:hypothetical protein
MDSFKEGGTDFQSVKFGRSKMVFRKTPSVHRVEAYVTFPSSNGIAFSLVFFEAKQLNNMPNDPPPKTRDKRIGCRGCLIILLIGLCLLLILAGIWIFTAFSPVPESGQPLFEPSVAANFITSPLDANGDVDYLEFVNQDSSRGVTRENNAMIPIVQAMGPTPEGAQVLPEFYYRMDITQPAAGGDHVIDLLDWYKSSKFADETADSEFTLKHGGSRISYVWQYVLEQPWSPAEFPEIAAYLKTNETPIALVRKASTMKEGYYPKVSDDTFCRFLSVLLPHAQGSRELARILTVRSQMNLHAGNVEEAIDDAVDTVKLGEMLSRVSDTLVENLVAIAIKSIGIDQCAAITAHNNTSAKHLEMLRDHASEFELAERFYDLVDKRERLVSLDSLQSIMRSGSFEAASPLTGRSIQPANFVVRIADPESAMIQLNRQYDQALDLIRRSKADPTFDFTTNYDAQMQAVEDEVMNTGKNMSLLLSSRKARGEHLGKFFASVAMPAIGNCLEAENRTNCQVQLLQLLIDVELFKSKQGQYPDELPGLLTEQRTEIPSDPFSGGNEYVYRKTDEHFQLYSIGPNQTDDGGSYDPTHDVLGVAENDDLYLEIPPPQTWDEFLPDMSGDNEFFGGMPEEPSDWGLNSTIK